ncbi:MAG: globin [Zetaproteobacteria bacterium CG12_big_fil_rev_8_21_14_0_65_54_13]|nr:MAG: globin [Zetaproteobacteria bacterium CG23_combo_of_CG06-09_8_20_14_all_54_7]PIW47935.1 MAG: globin [Zetaproteobacteria bacterium CG12_big_fil_rev_8_21_14_0_65_54_13]PIX53803.1 MAG: globin [Zetaproteobacteria bacterium CG_4_10_14_3_um_filter_54_28]PJA30855.1 MAG: globin [Zetaproteobacteria bacterium CG_4_9_14_3_um_filter_54_145]
MQIQSDTRTLYQRIGGEAKLRRLVQRFYKHMDELPEALPIRWMHADNLQTAEDKLFMFLSGWMGGPQLYIEQFGHPRLRMRHISFSIGEAERDQWIQCMKHALDDVIGDEILRTELLQALYGVADFMRNQPE